ncbi:MAG: tRNA uridine-5-carboxymethylaminomethyl(34) synthesis GTPase MnmE, partial [Lentisphaeria bacterium]|nr:tRNA uridine-5-carboxymethylaminomethyl(34) synthesis GTPase MnmE [Lentisphaeria bacterium]
MRLGHALSPAGETCIAVFMPGPHSYTGEDVVELQCHGGNFAPERLLKALLANGARLADPGEFTRRAFLNGKMDLTQAEAVLDIIQARTADAVSLAERQLSGALGKKIHEVSKELPGVLAEIESRLDFPEEDLNWRTPEELIALIAPVMDKIRTLLAGGRAGAIIRNGVR